MARVCFAYKWSRQEVMFNIPLCELWIWDNAGKELDAINRFNGIKLVGDGFLKQESKNGRRKH